MVDVMLELGQIAILLIGVFALTVQITAQRRKLFCKTAFVKGKPFTVLLMAVVLLQIGSLLAIGIWEGFFPAMCAVVGFADYLTLCLGINLLLSVMTWRAYPGKVSVH